MTINSETTKRLYSKHRNFILYGFIGGFGASLDFLLFTALVIFTSIDPVAASVMSVSVGIINNFFMNLHWNFRKKGDSTLDRFVSFYLTGLGGVALTAILIFILHSILDVDPIISKLLTVIPVVALQFFVNKKFSMGDKTPAYTHKVIAFLKVHWLEIFLLLASLLIFLALSITFPAYDETDNMLGGKLIVDYGQLPYVGFFSQHSPGMYFLTALFYLLTDSNMLGMRVLFALLSFSLMLLIAYQLRRYVGQIAFIIWIVVNTSLHAALGQTIVGEALLFYFMAIPLLYVISDKAATNLTTKKLVIFSLSLSLIPLVSLSYIIPAAFVYLGLLLRYTTSQNGKSIKRLLLGIIISFAPFIAYFALFILSGMLHDLVFQLLTFNNKYYPTYSQEASGGIAGLIASSVLNTTQNVGILAQNIIDPKYTFNVLLIIPVAAYVVFSLVRNSVAKGYSLLLIPLLLFINMRVNIWHPSAISTDLADIRHHGIPYLMFAAFIAAIFFGVYLQRRRHRSTVKYQAMINVFAILYLTVVPLTGFGYAATMLNRAITKQDPNYYSLQKIYPSDNPSTVANKLLDENDYAWIGPDQFKAQLYLEPKRATVYTFFGAQKMCPECIVEFANQLKHDKPKVIYYHSALESAPRLVRDILTTSYYQVDGKGLKYYYFLSSEKGIIDKRLETHGYITEQ